MIRDQFAKASKDWRTRQILLTAPMMLRRDPCRIMKRPAAARDEGTLTGAARVTALGFFQLTRRARNSGKCGTSLGPRCWRVPHQAV